MFRVNSKGDKFHFLGVKHTLTIVSSQLFMILRAEFNGSVYFFFFTYLRIFCINSKLKRVKSSFYLWG